MNEDETLYCCGSLDHSRLPVIVDLAAEVFSSDAVSIYQSQFDGSEGLRIRCRSVYIDTQMGSDSLISGNFGTTVSDADGYLRAFSKLLSESDIKHQFELYDNKTQLIAEFKH